MSTTLAAPAAALAGARTVRNGRLGNLVKAWWAAHKRRRAEWRAAERLRGMSERELKDIGLVRAEIDFAVQRDRRVDLGR